MVIIIFDVMNKEAQLELENVLDQYDIGSLLDFLEDQRGFVNTSFTITALRESQTKKYFLRRYKKGVHEEDIRQEHSIICHLVSNDFNLVANVLSTKSGSTYLQWRIDSEDIFYAVFEFLKGEDRYTWVDPNCTKAEVASSASVLARFHLAVGDFLPAGNRVEPKILEMRSIIIQNAEQCSRTKRGNDFDCYWKDHSTLVFKEIERVYQLLDKPAYSHLIQLVNHCDYHPGNLKFDGEDVVGLFDFDWSKRDVRIFDVALALFYFFTDWQGELDGALRLDEVGRFLNTYQQTLKDCQTPPPLSGIECQFMPAMIAASNLYILNWTLIEYLKKDIDPQQYFVFLKHSVRMISWLNLKSNWSSLAALIEKVCSPNW